jgi:N-acetylglucosaminyldiphosphoundecaprenol N-acetyl-beta-D-mannosaminyltransferase
MTSSRYFAPPRANVLGVAVHAIDIRRALDAVTTALDHHRKGYVCLCSVHGIMEAHRDSGFANILAKALLAAPDGMPLVWLGRLQGFASMRRVFGPDLMLVVVRF